MHRLLLSTACLGTFLGVWWCGPTAGRAEQYALLVGCTKYHNLPLAYELRGPRNDLPLMQQLLTSRFGFSADRMVVLSEDAPGADHEPTRANIAREFQRLAARAKAGDTVVILLAGHGSQQPDDPATNDPEDSEPDGFDEIFLPCDVADWDGKRKAVTNAITDDELRRWLGAISAQGASVWFIADACHSGTMTRGGLEETSRQVPADVLVPAAAVDEARAAAAARGLRTRGGPSLEALDVPRTGAAMVALFASQANEQTVELRLPPEADRPAVHGLLSYALCQVLQEATATITYRELVQQVQDKYLRWHPFFPHPMLETADADREVLGLKQWPGRSRIQLRTDKSGTLLVNTGTLQGVRAGSVLAVYPPAGGADADTVLGYVRIAEARIVDATVTPIAYGGKPPAAQLPAGGRCELVYYHFGDLTLRVAVVAGDAAAAPAVAPLLARLKAAAAQDVSLLRVVEDRAQAEWLIRVANQQVSLAPAGGVLAPASAAVPAWFGPAPLDDQIVDWLEDSLRRVARVQNLLALSAHGCGVVDTGQGLDVHLELLRYQPGPDGQPTQPEAVPWDNGWRLHVGDIIGFRVANRGAEAVDVTLLFLDADYGIIPFFPRVSSAGQNTWQPREQRIVPRRAKVEEAAGPEHMLLLAVRAENPAEPVDFHCLAQPSLERTRGNPAIARGLDTPLGRLLRQAVFADGQTRGLGDVELGSYAVRRLTWEVVREPRP